MVLTCKLLKLVGRVKVERQSIELVMYAEAFELWPALRRSEHTLGYSRTKVVSEEDAIKRSLQIYHWVYYGV